MKKLLLGAVLGMAAACAVYSASNQKCVRKTKRAIIGKLEDLLD